VSTKPLPQVHPDPVTTRWTGVTARTPVTAAYLELHGSGQVAPVESLVGIPGPVRGPPVTRRDKHTW